MEKPRAVLMLAFPGGQMLDVTGPLQMFAGANDELARQAYRIMIAAPAAGPFATSSGVRLVADLSFAALNLRRLQGVHTLMVAGGSPGIEAALEAGDAARIVARANGIVPRLSSVCSGAFTASIASGPTRFCIGCKRSASSVKPTQYSRRLEGHPGNRVLSGCAPIGASGPSPCPMKLRRSSTNSRCCESDMKLLNATAEE